MNIDIILVSDSFPFPHVIGHQVLSFIIIPQNGPKDVDTGLADREQAPRPLAVYELSPSKEEEPEHHSDAR